MSHKINPPFRADHVGSFLRPKNLLEARDQNKAGKLSAADLRKVEDEAIKGIIKFQEDLGVKSVTDGEFRRTFFHIDFLEQLAGVEMKGGMQVQFKTAGKTIEMQPPMLYVTGKVKHVKPIEVENFKFVKANTKKGTPKMTIPSPTMLHFRGGRGAIDEKAYPDIEEFYSDVAKAYQTEIKLLADAGCTYLQMDDTNLAYLCDPKMREGAKSRGDDPNALTHRYAKLINAALEGKPANMAIGIHLCRGNFQSAWAAEGDYEPVAEALLNEMNVDTYFLEYDDARSGGFKPLRFLPKGKTVVLGLVSSKLEGMESKDEIKKRIEEAAKYAPLDQLCLSPQCGFSSTVHGNDIAADVQGRKLKLVQEIAREVWGEA